MTEAISSCKSRQEAKLLSCQRTWLFAALVSAIAMGLVRLMEEVTEGRLMSVYQALIGLIVLQLLLAVGISWCRREVRKAGG